jgi:hypothetical protein
MFTVIIPCKFFHVLLLRHDLVTEGVSQLRGFWEETEKVIVS